MIKEFNGNIGILFISYTPKRLIKMPDECIHYCTNDGDSALAVFNMPDALAGYYDPTLVKIEASFSQFRKLFLDYGIIDRDDISRVLNFGKFEIFRRFSDSLRSHDGPVKRIREEALADVDLFIRKANKPSLVDKLYLIYESLNCSHSVWALLGPYSYLNERPKGTGLLFDGIVYYHKWILHVYGRSPFLFFLQLGTVILATSCNNRSRLFVLWGVPFAGKSTFAGLLSRVLDVFRLMYLDEQNLDSQLIYAKFKDLILLDDAISPTLYTLLRSRNILDGFPIVGNQKFKHRTTFTTPPILVTTNEDMEFVDDPPEGKTVSDVVMFIFQFTK